MNREHGQGIVEYALVGILIAVSLIVIAALIQVSDPDYQKKKDAEELAQFKARYETCIQDESNSEAFCLAYAQKDTSSKICTRLGTDGQLVVIAC